MQALAGMRLCRALFLAANIPSLPIHSRPLTTLKSLRLQLLTSSTNDTALSRGVLISPWSAIQERGAKCVASDIRVGDVIRRKGRVSVVVSQHHSMRSRGSASMQVELRDLANNSKVHERLQTTETIETVFVEKKDCTFLHRDGKNVVLSEEKTGDQIEVSVDLFGKTAVYLTEDLPVTLKLYDGQVMSASVPSRVQCTVVDPTEESDIASVSSPSPGASNKYKKVLLDNGLIVLVPNFVDSGDEILIKTEDNAYFGRA